MVRSDLRGIWEAPGTLTAVLAVMFVDMYGTGGLRWAPETILAEIQDDCGATLPQANFDRLMVGINLLTSDAFFNDLPTFVSFCTIMGGGTYDPHAWRPADCAEVAWGITEALLLDPPSGDNPFSNDICSYITGILHDEGIIVAPDILKIAIPVPAFTTAPLPTETDDPTLFSAIYTADAEKTSEINAAVRENLGLLLLQLADLPLVNGKAVATTAQLSALLMQDDQASD